MYILYIEYYTVRTNIMKEELFLRNGDGEKGKLHVRFWPEGSDDEFCGNCNNSQITIQEYIKYTMKIDVKKDE